MHHLYTVFPRHWDNAVMLDCGMCRWQGKTYTLNLTGLPCSNVSWFLEFPLCVWHAFRNGICQVRFHFFYEFFYSLNHIGGKKLYIVMTSNFSVRLLCCYHSTYVCGWFILNCAPKSFSPDMTREVLVFCYCFAFLKMCLPFLGGITWICCHWEDK